MWTSVSPYRQNAHSRHVIHDQPRRGVSAARIAPRDVRSDKDKSMSGCHLTQVSGLITVVPGRESAETLPRV